MAATKDTRWLQLQGKTWFAVLEVPRDLRAIIGKRRLKRTLKTHSLTVAQARRHAALAVMQGDLARARGAGAKDDLVQEGLAYREQFEAILKGDGDLVDHLGSQGAPWDDPSNPIPTPPPQAAKEWVEFALGNRVDDLRLQGRERDASILAGVAYGTATPLDTYLEPWLAEGGARGPVTPRTAVKYRAVFAAFTQWLAREQLPLLIETTTKEVAGRWITSLISAGIHPRTINARVSAMSAYWRWLMKRTNTPTNPWAQQAVSNRQKPGAQKSKRAYTDAELLRLLTGPASSEIYDTIRIAALSGMRLDEIYRLKVGDCQSGLFRVPGTKSAAAARTVPIHSVLAPIIAARTMDRGASAYLIHEAGGDPKPGRERSMLASKRFATYRRAVGVTDKPPGQRQDRVDFHSLRRWFVTTARNAGNDLSVVQRVVGHATGNITDDVYSDGPSLDRLKTCIESVKLPSNIQLPQQVTDNTQQ